MKQHTSPAKVMARIEVEVRLIGAISTGDVVMETLLKAVGEPTAASLRSSSCACSMAAVHPSPNVRSVSYCILYAVAKHLSVVNPRIA